jgi:hypothetical protein
VARNSWQKIPCYFGPDKRRYIFSYNDKIYYCGRMNYWQTRNSSPELAIQDANPPAANDYCYVSGKYPLQAVYRFDAYKHLSDGIGNFSSAALVLVACALITSKRRSPPQARGRIPDSRQADNPPPDLRFPPGG